MTAMPLVQRLPRIAGPAAALLLVASGSFSAELTIDTAPSPGEPAYPAAHFRPAGGWVGDVHPYFYRGRWHIAYLEVPSGPLRAGLFGLHSALISSNDLMNWEKHQISNSDPSRDWWLIANHVEGDVIHTFYNGDSGIDYAVSKDGLHWERHDSSPVIRYQRDALRELRDPFVAKVGENDYRMVLASRLLADSPRRETGAFQVSRSSDLLRWTEPEILYFPGNIYVPECPDLFRMDDGMWYLLGSWGTTRVGRSRYRVAPSPDGPWSIPRIDTIDTMHFPAPNSATDGSRRLIWSWVPTYRERRDFGTPEWGGDLTFPREVHVTTDGTLALRAPAELLALRAESLNLENIDLTDTTGDWVRTENGVSTPPTSDYARIVLPGGHRRFEIVTSITLDRSSRATGVAFLQGSASDEGYEMLVDPIARTFSLRRHHDHERTIVSQVVELPLGSPMELRIFVDGGIVEAFLDQRYALAGRIHPTSGMGARINLFTHGGAVSFSGTSIHGLRRLYEVIDPPAIPLPPVKEGSGPADYGNAIYFPRPFGNAHTPGHEAFDFKDSFTISCRFMVPGSLRPWKRNLLAKAGSNEAYHYGLNLTRSEGLEFYLLTPRGHVGVTSESGTVGERDRWIHVVAVADRAQRNLRLYKDGKRMAILDDVDVGLAGGNAGPLRLGYAAGGGSRDPFIGAVDDVAMWSRALEDEEIRTHWRQLSSVASEGLVAAWTFDGRPPYPNRTGLALRADFRLYDGAVPFTDVPDPATTIGNETDE